MRFVLLLALLGGVAHADAPWTYTPPASWKLDPSLDASVFPSLKVFEAVRVEGYTDPKHRENYLVLTYFEVPGSLDAKQAVDEYWKGLGKHATRTTSRMVTDRYMLDGDAVEPDGLRHHHKFMARSLGTDRVAIAALGCFSSKTLVPACEDSFASFALPAEAAPAPAATLPTVHIDDSEYVPPPTEPEERGSFVTSPFILVAGIAVIALLVLALLLSRKRKLNV